MQATLEMKKAQTKIYNIWYKGRLVYIRALSIKQIVDYFKEKEGLRIGNIYECNRKWLWPDFDKLKGDVKFDLTRPTQ